MIVQWQNCYDDSWKDLISPESFSHPAKYSRGLIQHIYQYCLEKQYFTEGMTILDPFGGIGLGAIATHYGLNWLGNELEPRFCQMAWSWDCSGIKQEDYDGYKGQCESPQDWHKLDLGCCSECVYKAIEGEQPQPGLFEQVGYFTGPHRYHGNLERFKKFAQDGTWAKLTQGDSRKLNEVWGEGLVSSPPFSPPGNLAAGGHQGTREDYKRQGKMPEASSLTEGNLEGMQPGGLVSSPPFASSVGSDDSQKRGGILKSDPKRKGDKNLTGDYGDSEGQLSKMDSGLVSSPPFEKSLTGSEDVNFGDRPDGTSFGAGQAMQSDYGSTPNNIGNDSGPTFWQAASDIVSQCYSLLAPGSYCVWITKNYIKNGKEVDFTGNWQQLCISCGFEIVEEIQAMLVKNLGIQTSHSGDDHEIIIERKSFFRRLFEANARATKHWKTLSKQDQRNLIMLSYTQLLLDYLDKLSRKEDDVASIIIPTKSRTISSAKTMGWVRDGKIRYDIDTAIDYETVTIMRKV